MRKLLETCIVVLMISQLAIFACCAISAEAISSAGPAGIRFSGAPTPDQNGTYYVGTLNTTYLDRYSTTINMTIFYPATSNGDHAPVDKSSAPYPIVQFTHGNTMFPPYQYYSEWGYHYASWGYVVALPDYGYYDNGQMTSPNYCNQVDIANSSLDCVSSMKVMNSTAGNFLEGLMDSSEIALTGHSMGGKTCIMAAETEALYGLTDIKVIAPMAMGDYYFTPINGPSTFPALYRIHIPVQLQCGQLDGVCPPPQHSQMVYNGLSGYPKQFFNITGGNHYYYADKDPPAGEAGDNPAKIPRAQQHELGWKYATSFFNYYLKHELSYYTYLYGAEAKADLLSGVIASNQFANIPSPPVPETPLSPFPLIVISIIISTAIVVRLRKR